MQNCNIKNKIIIFKITVIEARGGKRKLGPREKLIQVQSLGL